MYYIIGFFVFIFKCIIIDMKRERLYIVEDKRFDQARERCLMIIRNHFGNASWLDSVFEHNDNPEGLTYLMYMFKQFMNSFYHDPNYRKKSVMRLAPLFCRLAFEANFQNNNPDSDKLLRLEQMLFYIYNMSISGKLDVSKISLDATYEDMESTFGSGVDELIRQEDERMSNTEYEKNSSYKMLGPLSFEDASYYGDCSCPDSLLCYTQDEDIFDNYTSNGKNECYVFLKDGWEDLEAVHDDESYSGYDEYGLSMIFVFVRNGRLVYCNTRWNHNAEYAHGCSCDHALTKEMLSEIIGINFNELFKEEDLYVKINQQLANGTNLKNLFDDFESYSDYYIVELDGIGMNYVINNQLLSKDWYYKARYFLDGYASVCVADKGWNLLRKDGSYVSDRFFDDIKYFSEGFCPVKINGYWNFINTEGTLVNNEKGYENVKDFKNGFCAVMLHGNWYFINTNFKIINSEGVYDCHDFMYGGALVMNGKRQYNHINSDGEINSSIWFETATDFYPDGIANVILSDGSYNYVNNKGKLLLKEKFDGIRPFSNGCGIVYIKNENDAKRKRIRCLWYY